MANYSALAELMSDHPEVCVIRSFSKLQIKSLLYYQAELAELEQELEEVEKADQHCSISPQRDFKQHWKSLSATGVSAAVVSDKADSQDARSRQQWKIVLRIRDVLKDYEDAILRYTAISNSTAPPKARSLKRLREWLASPEFGDSFLSGKTEGVWDHEKGFEDFAVLSCRSNTIDGLTFELTAFLTYLVSFLKRGKQPAGELHVISSQTKTRLDRAMVTTVSSMFPVIPIIILFFINQLLVRLGLVLLFTVLFAFILVFGLSLDSDKTLAVTTAFAAIQVVFVGSTNSGLGSNNQGSG